MKKLFRSGTTDSRGSRRSGTVIESETDGEVTLRPRPKLAAAVSHGLELKNEEQPSVRRVPRTKEEIELSNLKKKTRKRTRRFEVDGVVVTTTTSKVRKQLFQRQ